MQQIKTLLHRTLSNRTNQMLKAIILSPFMAFTLLIDFVADALCLLWVPIGFFLSAAFCNFWFIKNGEMLNQLKQSIGSEGIQPFIDFSVVHQGSVILSALALGFFISGIIRILATYKTLFYFAVAILALVYVLIPDEQSLYWGGSFLRTVYIGFFDEPRWLMQ